MKKTLRFLLALSFSGLGLSCVDGNAQQRRHHNFTINTGNEKSLTGCGQITMRVDDWQVARSEQERSAPLSPGSTLRIQSPLYGGISAQGWDGDHYAIKACLGAAAESAGEAQRVLSQLALTVQDGRVTVTGPGGESWMGYLIVLAPKGASIGLEAKNAPIGVSALNGSIEARNQNGPLSLRDVDGRVHAEVLNGPINVAGSRGEFHLNVQNGPLNVELLGSRWESGELEGRTQNGPVNLRLPPDYQSAVRVNTSEHSPVECRAPQCKGAARTWDKPSVIEFGGPNPVIRLSTVNGPTNVASSFSAREK
jgi:hypothetical protein